MTIVGYKRLTIVSFLLLAGLLGFTVHLAMKCSTQRADEGRAWGVIWNYGSCRDLALRSDPATAVSMLRLITSRPRRTNTPLDLIVQRERERVIHEVIEYLRV